MLQRRGHIVVPQHVVPPAVRHQHIVAVLRQDMRDLGVVAGRTLLPRRPPELDPLEYDLLFERFLNPERVSMPDFDICFCMDRRDEVIDYVVRTYGRDQVSQIITYGSMAAKAVVRDVGRVYGHPYGMVDRIAKLIPFEIGMTLTQALKESDELKQLYDDDDEVQSLINMALKLEGVTRNAGKHAGGVVISPSLLTDFSPLYCEPGGGNLVTKVPGKQKLVTVRIA